MGGLACGAIHSRHPPASHNFRLGYVLQINHAEKVVGEPVKMRRNRGVAPARPPQAIHAQARHLEKGDLPHLGGPGDIVNRNRARPPVHHRRFTPRPGISRKAISLISAGREIS